MIGNKTTNLLEGIYMNAYGGLSQALGVNDKLVPSGICGNPCSDELLQELQKADNDFLFDETYDYPFKNKLRAIETNPINKCIFCKDDGLCYFAGDCENRTPIK